MSSPKPHQSVRGSKTGRPIMALLDLLGQRWILRILWELREDPLGFRELQKRCDNMSSSVLARRLNDLMAAGILKQNKEENYQLSEEGQLLLQALWGLNGWAERWAARSSE